MGGDLAVYSRLGEGASFTLSLPRAEVMEGQVSRPRSGDYPSVERRPVT
jgi:hypothetical protein